jgi:hypothetical protein
VCSELGDEAVLFENGRIGPSRRAVELDDDRRRIFDADLIDAVLVAAECLQPPVARDAHALERVEHAVGRELRVRMLCRVHQYSTGIGSSERHRYHVATLR